MPRAEPYGAIPQFKSLLTGCDNFATILDEYGPYKDEEGIWMKKYLVVPADHLIKQYQWLMEEGRMMQTRYGYAIWVEYPYRLINDKNTSKTNAIVRVYCAFDGGETTETERHKYYTSQIEDLEKESNIYKEAVAYYRIMLQQALDTDIALAKKLAELMDVLSKGGRRHEFEEPEEQIPPT